MQQDRDNNTEFYSEDAQVYGEILPPEYVESMGMLLLFRCTCIKFLLLIIAFNRQSKIGYGMLELT